MFLTMLRGSNIMPERHCNFDTHYPLKWENIQKRPYGLLITITHSKTQQYGERDHEIPLSYADNPKFCPVRCLERLARLHGPSETRGPNLVFRIPSPSGKLVPLKKCEFVGWLKSHIKAMGLPVDRYGYHSFRHGGVQEAIVHEPNRVLVQLASGHSSEAIMGYAQIPPERRMHLSRKVSSSLSAADRLELY